MYATLALPGILESEAPKLREVSVRSVEDLRKAMEHARHCALRVDASGLDRILRLDAARQLLEVQAATPWSALAAYLGAAAPELVALAGDAALAPTVQESVALNAPGPDGHPICAHVEALALVTADGELRRANRHSNRELFAFAVGGLGVFGIPYSVTLRLGSLRQSCAAPAPEARLDFDTPGCKAESDLTLLVPPGRLDAFLAKVREQTAEWRIPIAGAVARRTLPEEETFLRWARREYAQVRLRLATPSGLGGRVRAAQARRELIDTAIAEGGAFPPAGIFDASRVQVETCYPELKAFLAEKRRIDPADRLYNAWYRHARGLLCRDPVTVRWGA
jgi:hypothetical protein